MKERLTADHLWAAMWEMFPGKENQDLRKAFYFGALWVDSDIPKRIFGSSFVK